MHFSAFIILLLPVVINGGLAGIKVANLQLRPKASCDYMPENRQYDCRNIVDKFPNVFYGNYHLKCTDCSLPVFKKEAFPHNNDLISFNMTNSDIQAIAKDAFQHLTTLQYIYLQNNALKRIDEGAFNGLRQIFELHLDHNEIKDLKHGFVNGFEANSLFLSHNLIEEVPNKVFEGIYGAMTLDLSHNKISTLHKDSFEFLKGLEYLDLQGNKLCNLPLGVFKHIRLLKDLNLSENHFKRFHLGTFSGLPNLYALNLTHNPLAVVDPAMLTSMENISVLDVTDTGIDFVDAMEIHGSAPQLKHIGLADNLWNCRVLQNIIQYLRTKQMVVMEHHHYDVTNIKGIACTNQAITGERIPFDVFLKYVRRQTDESQKNIC
ncbi:leucine-rich repeat-containing protein 15-like [Atheta coriaria]|uniref:leucine-rich repeat-containing protein 15-like n=1 Tax=Dalotia coriaria TaxID=877792 RepID=UPI0031F3D5D3